MKLYAKYIQVTLLAVIWANASSIYAISELEKSLSIYEDSLTKCELHYKEGLENWPTDYIEAISTLRAKAQQAGNLEVWSVANKELLRFEKDPRITNKIIEDSSPLVRKIQQDYKTRYDNFSLDRCKSIISLKDKYISHLSLLQKSLTKAGKIEEAFGIRSEIERVNKSEVVTASEFVLADYDANNSNNQLEPETVNNQENMPEKDQTEPVGQAEVVVTPGGVTVYPTGDIPSHDSKLVFKRRTLKASGHSPFSRPVSVSAWEMTSKTTERDGHSKTVTDASSVRLSVRLRSNENKEENLRIYVQHYQKPANARLKRIDPSPLDAKGVELSVLDNEAIYLDFPEVTAKVVQQHRHVSGNKLYGFIVSIYDKNGEILYQASPVSSLRNIAKPQEPAFSGMDLRGAEANFVENNNNKPENELPQAAIRISEGPLSDARKRFFRALNAHRANPQNQKLKDEYDEALKAFHHARANAE